MDLIERNPPPLRNSSRETPTGPHGSSYSDGSSESMRDYHSCLGVLLQPPKQMQDNPPVLVARRGDEHSRVKLIVPIATVVVGDNLSNNKLCGKSSNNWILWLSIGKLFLLHICTNHS